jgi:hypothetical protein
MSKSKIGPEAKIITLFAALSDESKRIVLDVIKSQSAMPRKATKKAEKPSGTPPAQKEALPGKEAKCGICGNLKGHPDHDTEHYLGAHEFEGPKPVARAGRKSKQKSENASSIPSSETPLEGVTDAAREASGGASDD